MSTTLITGANKGLGYETARRLLADGHDVWVAARDPQKGESAAGALGARFVQLDVTDDESVRAAAERVSAESGLDVLVNNAGIVGHRKPVSETTPDDVRLVFETNVLGVVRVTRAFLPLLERSTSPVIVNVSSGMGSIAITTNPSRLESTLNSLAYPTSKTAVNMLTTQYAKAFPRFGSTPSTPATQLPTSTSTAAPSRSSRAPRSSSGWRSWTAQGQRAHSLTRTALCPGDRRGRRGS